MTTCKFIIVGDETVDNFRLSQTIRKIHGTSAVDRVIEIQNLQEVVDRNQEYPTVICLDLFGYSLKTVTDSIGYIRDQYPKAVFNLYVNDEEFINRRSELPEHWQTRLNHYYRSYKEEEESGFEPGLRATLRPAIQEALHNMNHEPIRLTPSFSKGIVSSKEEQVSGSDSQIAFVSYSRADWSGFVATLVQDLGRDSQQVWIDQDYIVGGDDWMDAIGDALEVCDSLLLVLSPQALSSKYVKMEYRHFFRQEKPIIPILFQHLEKLPFELASLHYLDFTGSARTQAYNDLLAILDRYRSKK